jgi:HAD superfamily hydrolase (TIGR01490 family)
LWALFPPNTIIEKRKMHRPTLAIFDLDFTLLDENSDVLWARFLLDRNLVHPSYLEWINTTLPLIDNGEVDLSSYYEIYLKPLIGFPLKRIVDLQQQYTQYVKPHLREWVVQRVEFHRAQQHIPIMVSAALRILVEPIDSLLNFPYVICSELEWENNRLTGKLAGKPAFRSNKIHYLKQWLSDHKCTLEGSWGYSDSFNDLPLLSLVENPVAVKPDRVLHEHAVENEWEVLLG